jgi:formate dehydrogenase major subunit
VLRVSINGGARVAAQGSTILGALREAGVQVPTLCHDPRLEPYGGCRLCAVRVKGWPRPVTSCNTPLADGMEIETHTPELQSLRKTLLRMLARHYPADAVRRFPEKEFHRCLLDYGLAEELIGGGRAAFRDHSHPYIHVDMAQCITCYRCVRICEEVQGQFVWQAWGRGDETEIRPAKGSTLLEGGCVSCGACVDTCPTGALEDKTLLERGIPTQWTRTTCPYCGTGCEMDVGTREGRIVTVRPSMDAPVNKGHLCVKGRYAFSFVEAADRVTDPMIRESGSWRTVSWDEALAFAADGLRRILAEHGADSIGVLGSSRATNEENYLAQKFARVVLGTNNVDCCARVCHTPTAAAMKTMLGTGAATNSYDDIEKARLILVCGANPTENHPVLGARIKQAVLRGARLIVVDPRRIELSRYADIHLALRPGTNVPLLNALAHAIVEARLHDPAFARERLAEWEEFQAFIQRWSPESVAEVCGVEAGLIREAARLYATEKPGFCVHGLGMTEHVQGTEGVMCLVNLALLTGNLGVPGAGINPLRGQNNVQGAAHMGCDPGTLTGSIALKEGRALFEEVWKAPLPSKAGLNQLKMMDAAEAGKLRALWVIGYDLFMSNAHTESTRRALGALELVIVQDLFLNETAKHFGTVFFPAAAPFEKDGTFMNAERRVQRIRRFLDPAGNCRDDARIVCDLACAMGKGEHFSFDSAEAIWREVQAVWAAGRGVSYARLETSGLQWPCLTESDPGTRILHGDSFSIGPRAALRRVDFRPSPETTDAEYPFLLITGRSLYQFNAGTMTMRTRNAELRPTDTLDISAADAERLGLRDGASVRIRSRYGSAALPLRIDAAVRPGELFATFQDTRVLLNDLTSPHRDRFVQTPEYKVLAVRLEKA